MTITNLRRIIIVAYFSACCAHSQPNSITVPNNPPPTTNYVRVTITNWYDPEPGLRTVNGQIYNPAYAQIWQTVVIPTGAAVLGAAYNGTVQPIDVTFTWGPLEGRDHQVVLVRNFPYNPTDFRHDRDNPESPIVTKHQLAFRVLPTDIQTNWTPLGRMWIGQRTYDYGVPYTGKIPIVTSQLVPADQAPTPSGTADIRPNTQTIKFPGLNAYTRGPFPERLAAIQRIPDVSKRDEFLLRLATDGALQRDVGTVEQSLNAITSGIVHDSAAQSAAAILVNAGKPGDAYTIAGTIKNPTFRNLALEQWRRQNR